MVRASPGQSLALAVPAGPVDVALNSTTAVSVPTGVQGVIADLGSGRYSVTVLAGSTGAATIAQGETTADVAPGSTVEVDAPPGDEDGDGVVDSDDGCPNDPDKSEAGACGCGVPGGDGDGIADCLGVVIPAGTARVDCLSE